MIMIRKKIMTKKTEKNLVLLEKNVLSLQKNKLFIKTIGL